MELQAMILARAQAIAGAGPEEQPLLELLCAAVEQSWRGRLREDAQEVDCRQALTCACAFTAAAGLLEARGGDGGAPSFTAGDLSVRGVKPSERAGAAEALRREAERLMADWVESDDFAVTGAPG